MRSGHRFQHIISEEDSMPRGIQGKPELPPVPLYTLVFYSHKCTTCRPLLGITPNDKRKKKKGELAKALERFERQGFIVVWINIEKDEQGKKKLISITGRHATWLPYIVSPFATLEGPGKNHSVIDYVDALLGLKTLEREHGYQWWA